MTDSKDKTLLPPSPCRFLKSKAFRASGHSAGQSHLLAHLGVEGVGFFLHTFKIFGQPLPPLATVLSFRA